MKNKIEYILKHNLIIQKIYRFLLSAFFRFIGLFVKIDNNLILFNSFGGRKYNDSPKVIFEHMINNPMCKNMHFIWAFEHPDKFKIPATKVKIDTWKYFIIALKAKYWVSSVNIERGLKFKKRETIYLNTWHGAGTKKIGNAVSKRKDFDYSNVDYMLIQSNYEKGIFRDDFLVKEESFLLSGFPRGDELFNTTKEQIKHYKQKLAIPNNKKVILYAPTWRDSKNMGISYDLRPPINIKKWQNKLQDEYVVLFRTHAFTTNVLNLTFNDFVRDVSTYNNLNHLILIADLLITDYSTIVFDFSILEKPFLCFGYDYEEYNKERGFYINLENEYPHGVLKNEDELLEQISSLNYDDEQSNVRKFKAKYIEAGGNSTELAVNALLKHKIN